MGRAKPAKLRCDRAAGTDARMEPVQDSSAAPARLYGEPSGRVQARTAARWPHPAGWHNVVYQPHVAGSLLVVVVGLHNPPHSSAGAGAYQGTFRAALNSASWHPNCER